MNVFGGDEAGVILFMRGGWGDSAPAFFGGARRVSLWTPPNSVANYFQNKWGTGRVAPTSRSMDERI